MEAEEALFEAEISSLHFHDFLCECQGRAIFPEKYEVYRSQCYEFNVFLFHFPWPELRKKKYEMKIF